MIDGVIFDKDGTLFDFRQSWGGWTRRLLQDLARDTAHADALAASIGFDLVSGHFAPESPVIAGTSHDIAAAMLEHLPVTTQAALVTRMNLLAVDAAMMPAVPLMPLLGALRDRGLKIGLATNDVEAAARAHLATEGVDQMFDLIAGYDSGHGAKPGPGMLLAFARQTGLSPDRVLMVGDSTHDLIAGRAAGMRPVAVLTGIAEAPELAPLAEVVLPDIGALPGWIDAQRAH